jgi:hypothetical protein
MRHLYAYADYLILESTGYSKVLMGLNSVVDAAITRGLDSQMATKEIKQYIDSNKQEIVDSLGKPDFTKAMLTILSKWSNQYENELDSSEFDYITTDQNQELGNMEDDEFDSLRDIDELPELDF